MNLLSHRPLFPLYSSGHSLNLSEKTFGFLRSSNDILADIPSLRKRMGKEGYLYLPRLISSHLIWEARKIVCQRLENCGALDLRYPAIEAWSNGCSTSDFSSEFGTNDNSWLTQILSVGPVIDILSRFLGGPIVSYPYKWFRYISPGRGTRPHADIVYMGRGTHRLYTVWIPMGNVSLLNGGLLLLEGSHSNPAIAEYLRKDVDEYCLNHPDAAEIIDGQKAWQWDGAISDNPVMLQKEIGGRWLTTAYSAGDIVIFSTNTIHGSLDNMSANIRLSVDCRYQLAVDPMDERWLSNVPLARNVAFKKGKIC